MKHPFVSLLVAGGCLVLVGCESIATRMKQREEVTRTWPPLTQERIARGEIKVGDDFDMVSVALGAPDGQETFTAKDGGIVTIWNYPKITQRFERDEIVNYEDVSEFDVRTGQRIHYQVPNRQKVYVSGKEPGMQIIFRNGRVSSLRWGGEAPEPAPTADNQVKSG
ncbi:hypothetical protein [Synoicihabitans lomoniglobus]|uniref:Lipoprotein n=1 Tax=Synoicihabitans lomoniglobus TaxID=2909285 RepID=A0AAE9ZRE4_9BACT|nr:hypothetical protein [Opitutaceae bacterium LMO-M01]WED63855.1 hypothetical protein PXH66_16070 [Opitutaceae bacterium LMO-M01]